MENMNITSAQYVIASELGETENIGITATVDGQEIFIPLTEGNRHYDEIMRQVAAGDLTIAEAE